MAQGRLDRLLAELESRNLRAGTGSGAIPPNLRRVQGTGDHQSIAEDIHTMRERLRGIRALIRESKRETDAVTKAIVTALETQIGLLADQLDSASDADFPQLWETLNETKKILESKKKEAEPMTCGICMDDLDESNFMCGKNCFHTFCSSCIATAGMSKIKPMWVDRSNPYWQFVNMQVVDRTNPDGSSVVEPVYTLRAEFSDDGNVAKEFPANTWVSCPVCRDPHYCDKSYFDIARRAIETLDDGDDAANEQQGTTNVIEEMREEEQLLLLEVPGDPTKVMFVEAKIEGVAQDGRFPHGPHLGGYLRAAGFQWPRDDPDVTGGAFAWWRAKHFDDVVDSPTFRGGELKRTVPRPKTVDEVTEETDHEGNQIVKRRKVSGGVGSWKFVYPAPPRANGNEAGPSGASSPSTEAAPVDAQ